MNSKYWPLDIEDLEQGALTNLIEERRALIRFLSLDLEIKALELFSLAEQDPAKARFCLYNFLVTRLDQLPILSEADQNQIEILINSLLPENFKLQFDCVKCLSNCQCK